VNPQVNLSSDLSERFPSLKRIALRRVRRRIPVVRQLAASDCGAAALAMVLGYHGKFVSLEELRKAAGGGRDGSTVAAILRVGRVHGLRGRAVRLEVDDLKELPPGTILHWEFRHFVVLEGSNRECVNIVDPAFGRRSVSMDTFRRAFTGIAVIFEPTDAFEKAEAPGKRISGLFRQILERKDLLVRIVSTSILAQILSAAIPLFTALLIDRVVPHRDYSLLFVLTLGYCVFQFFNTIAGFVRAHLLIHFRTQLELRFTLRFLDHLMDLPYSFFQQHTSGDLMVRMGSNNAMRDILTSTALSALMDGALASIYLAVLLLASLPLTIAVVVLALLRLGLLAIIRRKQRQLLGETLENQARSQTYQVEMLSGMETLKGMGLEHRAAENWSNIFVDGLNVSIKTGKLDAIFNALLSALGTVSTLALMFYGAFLVLNGTLTLGTMMAFGALAAGFLSPLNSLVSSILQLQFLEIYLERLNDVMNTPAEQGAGAMVLTEPLRGGIILDHVSFRYAAQDWLVLQDVSLEISPGQRVALVGRTGSGKSTLARLLAGLYDPSSGRILFDEKDLKTLDRRSLRSRLGIVTQDTQLFGGSIRRNIALAEPQMGIERVIRAAKLACMHDEIMATPMGYETLLMDRGLSLSGGQRQRLAIARALARNPEILVLDEATSHLDAATEERINDNLASLRCTRIVIAHRLSTIRDADLIVVVDKGRIVEMGTHEQLIHKQDKYVALLGSQREDNGDRIPSPVTLVAKREPSFI
jgi:ABC-type bacteriocin/lantibiotic exporter with double-glycine peptidase domain